MADPVVQSSPRTRPRRSYHSPVRATAAASTRRRIRDAAEALFLRDGYVRSTTKAIAHRAGVAEKTLFLTFPTKAALLSEIIRVHVRDDGDVPLGASDEWHRVLDAPDDQLLTRFATLNTAILNRTARLLAMAEAAATTQVELVALRDRGHAAQRTVLHDLATELSDRRRLRPDLTIPRAADVLYALTNEAVYLRLVDECGWTPADYSTWLSDTLRRSLTAGTAGPPARGG